MTIHLTEEMAFWVSEQVRAGKFISVGQRKTPDKGVKTAENPHHLLAIRVLP
jgi:hypothetical protein